MCSGGLKIVAQVTVNYWLHDWLTILAIVIDLLHLVDTTIEPNWNHLVALNL